MTYWTNPQHIGLLPEIFLEDDPRTAQEQANDRYNHGGGWHSFSRFTLGKYKPSPGVINYVLVYPGDPVMRELSRTNFHKQLLVLFESSWVGIIENEELLDVARID